MKLNIGENIRSHRKQADMTQEQLADILGVSFQSVSRWENGSTYPDMEFLPSISKIFGITIDELLGMPDEKKEEIAEETFSKLAQASYESPVDVEKVKELIRDIRRNYLDSQYLWHFWLSVNNRIYLMSDVLPEVRLTVEAILDSKLSIQRKNEAISYMAKIEDDEHIDKFLERYASEQDLRKNALLIGRYRARGEWDKDEPLRQLFLFYHVDQLIGNSKMWRNISKSPDLNTSTLANELKLNLLHQLCAQIPDEKHPISGNGEVDLWVEPRLWMGFRKACNLASTGDADGAYTALEDTVSLLEKAMQITSPIELRCKSPWLDQIVWTAEEDWANPGGSPIMANEEERCIWIHNADGWCYVLYPSWYRDILTEKTGWEWFEPICNDPRYNSYIDRLNALVVKRPKNGIAISCR